MRFLQQALLIAALVVISRGIHAADTPYNFSIEAQDLGPALQKLATQSAVSIFYASDSVAGRKSKGLVGRYTINAALTEMLSGSGLEFSLSADGSISVKPAASQLNNLEPTTLPKVKVVGNAVYDDKDPYNEDYLISSATSGTKTDTPIMETPLNVQVISKQVMKDQQVISLADAIKNVSGVTAATGSYMPGNAGISQTFYFRGFASETFFRDGFRLQQGSASREMANVESVEVLKGPAAILYGMVEPGGMVNIITKQPLAKPYYALNQQFGSFNNYRTTVDSTGPVTKDDTLLYRLNMSYQNSDSFRQFAGKEDVFLAPVLKWNISSKTQATLDFEYNYQHVGLDVPFIPFVNGQLTHIPQSLNYGEYSPGVIQSFYGGFNWSHQFNDDWKLKQRFSVNQGNTDISAWIFPTSATNTQVARFRAGDVFQNNTYSSGIDLTGHFDTLMLKHTLLLGGDYYRLDQNFQENTNLDPINFLQYSYIDIVNPVHPGTPYTAPNMPYYSQSTLQDQFGAYIQDQIKLPYDFQVMGGIRYQNIHQNLSSQTLGFPLGTPTIYSTSAYSQDAVTPRVGLLWQAKDWLSLYTNYVESFGANTGIVFTGLNTPPKPVPPTSAIQYEGGIKTEFFDGRLRANWAYFDLTKTNIATADPAHQALGPYVIAAGAARSRGTEMDITGEILPGWNAILTYSYLDATIIKSFETASNGGGPAGSFGPAGSRLWGVSHNNASLWSTYELQQGELKGLKFGGGVTVRDGQTACCDTPSFNIPGYATLNLLTSYSLNVGKSKITAQMNVNNLLDKYYITGLYTSLPGNAAYADFGAPRNFMGSIGIQY